MNIQHISRPLSIKSLGSDGYFTGYASVFDHVDSYNEVVAKGAFERTLANWRGKNAAPAMLWMHDPTMPIGIWVALTEDQSGLVVHGRLALTTQQGREAYELLKLKALTGLSIGYRVVESKIDSKRKVRVLTDVELFEISLVTFPANDAARVSNVKAPRIASQATKKRDGKKGGASRATTAIDVAATRAVVARLNQATRVLKGQGK